MADELLVLCDVLCFSVNKYQKTPVKLLKSCLADFFAAEVLSEAKNRLLADITVLNSTVKLPHISQHRDGDGRVMREVEDILSLLACLDENKLMDKLPYVASGPDSMPSMRLYEGDLNIVMSFMEKMNQKFLEIGSSLAAITHDVRALQAVSRAPESTHLSLPVINKTTTDHRHQLTAGLSLSAENSTGLPTESATAAATNDGIATRETSTYNWASLVSTPVVNTANRFAVLQTTDNECSDNNQDDQRFTAVSSRRSKRRKRSPEQRTGVDQTARPADQQTRRAPPVVGQSVSRTKVAAAWVMYKKMVYCIDNVSTDCSVDDIRSFVTGLGVRVLTCFEVNSRRRRSDIDDHDVKSRKAFRLCIPENDRAPLLDTTKWPDSVFISEWYFKPKASRIDGETRGDDRVRSAGTSQTITATSAVTQASQPSSLQADNSHAPAVEPLSSSGCLVSDNAMDEEISDNTILYHNGAAIETC